VLLLVTAFIVGGFFGVDVLGSPWALTGMTVVAFAAGMILRLWRQREHAQAVAVEYTRRTPVASEVAESGKDAPRAHPDSSAASADMLETVTFRSSFTLPGLERRHPAGTFRVSERRQPLDVSWDASLVTKTIMLTEGGTVEALDVKADDLAEALRRDHGQTFGDVP